MSAERSATQPHYTAGVIRRLASANNVAVVVSSNDVYSPATTLRSTISRTASSRCSVRVF
jgi:hypothetical protein